MFRRHRRAFLDAMEDGDLALFPGLLKTHSEAKYTAPGAANMNDPFVARAKRSAMSSPWDHILYSDHNPYFMAVNLCASSWETKVMAATMADIHKTFRIMDKMNQL